MSRPRTLVLFDVDGTLIDSQSHILGAMEFAFKMRGLVLPPASEILAIVGLSLPEAFAQLCPEADAQERLLLVEAYKDSFANLRDSASASALYPGALACLDRLKHMDDVVLGIATGKSRRGLRHVLSNPDLAGRFATTQVADDHPSKPHPSMALQAMTESGAVRGVMIGDTTFDMQMGRAAGLKTIGVSWGYHAQQALRAQADRMIADYAQLVPEVQNLWGEI